MRNTHFKYSLWGLLLGTVLLTSPLSSSAGIKSHKPAQDMTRRTIIYGHIEFNLLNHHTEPGDSVYIYVLNSDKAAVSDSYGNYQIDVTDNLRKVNRPTLVFKSDAFETRTKKVKYHWRKRATHYNVTLEPIISVLQII